MNPCHKNRYDVIVSGGRVIDPANQIDGTFDVGITGNRIVAIEPSLAEATCTTQIDARGKVVSPGLIDLHTHVNEFASFYGVNADRAGIQNGCTTIVDMASTGAPAFGGLRGNVVERSVTDVRAFLNVLATGTLIGWLPYLEAMKTPPIHPPSTIRTIEANRDVIRGVKVHGEVGAVSRWGYEVIKAGRAIADECKLPLYMHTGHLYPIIGESPPVDSVLYECVKYLREGDVFGHLFAIHKSGIWTRDDKVHPAAIEASKRGVLFEVGHADNFVFSVARAVLDAGIRPHIISSDVHGDTKNWHKSDELGYSMVGTMTKVWALGLELADVIAMSTVNPAGVIGLAHEKGTLGVGRQADVTILDVLEGDYEVTDTTSRKMRTSRKLRPNTTIIRGQVYRLDPNALPEHRKELAA